MNPLVLCFVARLFFDDKASKDASPSVQKHMQTSPSHRNNVCKMVLVALPSSFHHPCYCSYLHPPPKSTQVCLHLGLYVCICNSVCCVSQGLSWLCHQKTAGLWDAPCVGTSVGKESCLSQCRETDCCWKGLLVAKPGAPALAPLDSQLCWFGGALPLLKQVISKTTAEPHLSRLQL